MRRSALAALLIVAASHLPALEVTLRLVRSDAPDQLVSTAVTKVDVETEKAEAKSSDEKKNAAASSKKGATAPQDEESKPRAEFDSFCNVMRCITIDQKHPFQRMYNGSYLGRTDTLTLKLDDGEHVIHPGAHKFKIENGVVTSDAPSLKVNGATIDIACYPVSIICVDGSAVREMPAEMRRLPVQSRVYWENEDLLPREKWMSGTATFKRLTLYMLANTTGSGYRLSPSDRNFHVTPAGVVVVDEKGAHATDKSIWVENKFSIILPKVAVPVTVRGDDLRLNIAGPAGSLAVVTQHDKKDINRIYYAFGAQDGAEITAGHRAKTRPMKFDGDLGTFSRRKIVADATSPLSKEPRLLQVATEGYSVDAGKSLRVRVKFLDAYDRPTIVPPQVAAYLLKKPVLQDDGWLTAAPSADAADLKWMALRVMAGPGEDLYDVVMPEVPSSAYWLRIVVDEMGRCSPASPLRADFIEGVINPAARTSLSVFCHTGRHAFLNGADLPISAVIKTTVPVPAGRLRIVLRKDGAEYTLVDRETAALERGCHPFHYMLSGAATRALMQGDYALSASLGELKSNTWTISLRMPRKDNPFPISSQGFLCENNIERGAPYVNVPADIAMANDARRLYRRNGEVLGRLYDVVTPEWTFLGAGQAQYQGRDSSSEVAQVERILRDNLSLPSHEVFYYQNSFESCCEALAAQGVGMVLHCGEMFAPLSLIHSVEKEVKAKMREYQVAAQIGQRFELIDAISFYRTETKPMGDSEMGDANRAMRYITMKENFVKKYGFEPPPMSEGAKHFQNVMNGIASPPELAENARRWELWAHEENMLVSDYNARGRAAVKPVAPNFKLHCEGPPHGYPVTNSAHEDVVQNCVGTSDAGWPLILDSFLRPKIMEMTGKEVWSIMGTMPTSGVRNIKAHVAGALAGGARGLGYYWGPLPIKDPTRPTLQHATEELRDTQELLKAFGAMFKQASAKAPIAIFYPYRQSMYDRQAIAHPKYRAAIADLGACAALAQLALLGYDAEVVSEEMLDAGELDRFSIAILPALYYAQPRHVEIFEKFAASGKPVLTGSLSTLIPKGARQIDDDFAEISVANDLWTFQLFADVGNSFVFNEMLRKATKLREIMAPLAKPFAAARKNRVFVQTRAAGDARYTIAWDCLYPSWMGTERVLRAAEHSAGGSEANETTLVPVNEEIFFASDMLTYDVLTQQPLVKEKQTDGTFKALCDLSASPLRIFVSIPRGIAALRTQLPANATLATTFPIEVTPVDAEGNAIKAAVPLRIVVLDAKGRQVEQIPAAANPAFAGRLNAPLGFEPGAWKVVVTELISGRQVELAVNVVAPQALPFGATLSELPQVDVQRPDLVREFIENRKKDGEAVVVLFEDSQPAEIKSLADEAVKQLTALGIKAVARRSSDPGVYPAEERVHLFPAEGKCGPWVELNPSTYIEAHVMLIGGEGQSTLIEELQENQLLLRPLTASYPGPGRGVLCAMRGPFALNRDVIGAFGPDAAGIRAAIAQLGKLAAASVAAKTPFADERPVQQSAPGTIVPGTPLAEMDGDPVQTVCFGQKGDRIYFGTSGYAKNVFALDLNGKVVLEEKLGYVNTFGVKPLSDGAVIVESDKNLYFREPSGAVRWRVPFNRTYKAGDYADASGRYVLLTHGNSITVHDAQLKVLWSFDDWDKAETRQDILYGRKARFIAAVDNGSTIAYHLAGKAPGLSGLHSDDLIYADALTGRELKRVPIQIEAFRKFVGLAPSTRTKDLDLFELHQNGAFAVVEIKTWQTDYDILLDEKLQPIAYNRYSLPAYHGGEQKVTNRIVLKDRRTVLTTSDALCITDGAWTSVRSVPARDLILSLVVDEVRERIAISDYTGRVAVYDFALRPIWEADVGSAARLAFAADGRLAAGTMRGHALLLDTGGRVEWKQSLTRYAPPEEVERRWSELEAAKTLSGAETEPFADLEKNVGLGADIARLSGNVDATALQKGACAGAAFGTYLVEWTVEAGAACSLSLDITEREKAAAGEQPVETRRLALSARSSGRMRDILRLGDKPESFEIRVTGGGEGSAKSTVSVRPLQFPSQNIIRIPALYRNMNDESAQVAPPAGIQLLSNLTEADMEGQWDVPWIEPFHFVNGRMFEREPGLLNGKWFGGSNTARTGTNVMTVPCFLEITLPRKRVISHIVIAEDPSLPRLESVCVEAFIESRETRQNVTEYEKRQAARGYLQSVVKKRGNTSHYNVYKLEKPVYTRKLQLCLLSGYSSINEIELYETLPKSTQ